MKRKLRNLPKIFLSFVEDWDVCFLCGKPKECTHHVFEGRNRAMSEAVGFKLPLCHRCHNMGGKLAVHFNKELDLYLKQLCQTEFEKKYSREMFLALTGRNYL